MSYELINLTLPLVITEVENVLDDYPESPNFGEWWVLGKD